MKVAIFGGSFNPVHIEHINIVLAAKRELALDKIIIIPSNITPQKQGRLIASGTDRLNMCRLAFEGIDGVEVSDFELSRGGVSYSYITCREFAKRYPDSQRFFIVGADMLENFEKWKYPHEILSCVTLAACAREDGEGLKALKENFKALFGKKVVTFDYIGKKVSSTRIRTLAALGESLNGLVDEKTKEYIKENSLYALPQLFKVKELLKPERWQHTVRVAIMAAENCARAGVSEEKAITAAALHDCAKSLSLDSELLKGFTPPKEVPESVMHQFSGAFVAEKLFGVTDTDILNAIKYHTSGRENMSAFEKLIVLSDMLEEGRDYDGVEYLREEFYRSLDGCMLKALERQIDYLEGAGKKIYPLTRAALKYLKENKNDL